MPTIPPQESWIPNWMEEGAYPDSERTPVRHWAWEFLRRNVEYRKLWQKIVAPVFAKTPKTSFLGDFADPDTMQLFEQEFGILYGTPPPWLSSTAPQFTSQHRIRFVQAVKVDLRPLNWRADGEPYVVGPEELDPYCACAWFNLSLPLPRQLKAVEKLLKTHIKNLKDAGETFPWHRANSAHYRDYLRVLDANEKKVSLSKIGKKLYPDSKNDLGEPTGKDLVLADLKAAKLLRDGDYRFVAAFSE